MKQARALELMSSGCNILLTGSAGSGKSFTIQEFVKLARQRRKKVVVTATTGLASSHIGGQTIHSWSGIGVENKLPEDYIFSMSNVRKKSIREADILIIDEISMLNAYALDMVDKAMMLVRENSKPFGGLQVILVGDFFQLPPIDKYGTGQFVIFSQAWKKMQAKICYLEEQHRQEDERLQDILNGIRGNTLRRRHLFYLQSRVLEPENSTIPRLYTLNIDVERINEEKLNEIQGDTYYFLSTSRGSSWGDLQSLQRNVLAPPILKLKIGAMVMAVKNDVGGRYFNGSLGVVSGFSHKGFPIVDFKDGSSHTIYPDEWQHRKGDKVTATLTQIPLRLAYAITVHKSQGMTLDGAEIDLSNAFVEGMGYVALSRVKTLDTLYLRGFNRRTFMVNPIARAIDSRLLEASRLNEKPPP